MWSRPGPDGASEGGPRAKAPETKTAVLAGRHQVQNTRHPCNAVRPCAGGWAVGASGWPCMDGPTVSLSCGKGAVLGRCVEGVQHGRNAACWGVCSASSPGESRRCRRWPRVGARGGRGRVGQRGGASGELGCVGQVPPEAASPRVRRLGPRERAPLVWGSRQTRNHASRQATATPPANHTAPPSTTTTRPLQHHRHGLESRRVLHADNPAGMEPRPSGRPGRGDCARSRKTAAVCTEGCAASSAWPATPTPAGGVLSARPPACRTSPQRGAGPSQPAATPPLVPLASKRLRMVVCSQPHAAPSLSVTCCHLPRSFTLALILQHLGPVRPLPTAPWRKP